MATGEKTANEFIYKPLRDEQWNEEGGGIAMSNATFDVADSKFGRVLHFGDPKVPAFKDGLTSDTARLQACLDYAVAQNYGAVYVPEGTYLLTTRVTLYHHLNFIGAGAGEGQTKFIISSDFPTGKDVATGGFAPFTTYGNGVSAHHTNWYIMKHINVDLSDGADATELFCFWNRHGVGDGRIEDCFFQSESTSNLHGAIYMPKYSYDDDGNYLSSGTLDNNFFSMSRCLIQRMGTKTGTIFIGDNGNSQGFELNFIQTRNCRLNMYYGGNNSLFRHLDFYGPGVFSNALTTSNTGYWPRIVFSGGGFNVFRDCYFDGAGGNIIIWHEISADYTPTYDRHQGFTLEGYSNGFTETNDPAQNVASICLKTTATAAKSGDNYVIAGANATADPYYMTAGKYIWAEVADSWRKRYQIGTATYAGGDTTLTFVGVTLPADASVTLYREADKPQFDSANLYRNYRSFKNRFRREIEFEPLTSTPTAISGIPKLYSRLNSTSGKYELVCLFPTGAVQVISTEP